MPIENVALSDVIQNDALGSMIDVVNESDGDIAYAIEDNGKPVAMLIAYSEYEDLIKLDPEEEARLRRMYKLST